MATRKTIYYKQKVGKKEEAHKLVSDLAGRVRPVFGRTTLPILTYSKRR